MRKLLGALLVALFVSVANPAPAAAHAILVSTAPGGWQLLDDSPGEVSMRFSEPVDIGLAQVRLVGPRGNDVAGLSKPTHPAGSRDAIAVSVPETLANGTYTVSWRVVSADTHPVQGAFTFSVREATGPAPVALAGPAPGNGVVAGLYGLARWLALAGFALLAGTALFVAVCWPGGAGRRGARRLLSAGLVTVLGATLAALLLYGPYASGRSLDAVLDASMLGTTLGSKIGIILAARVLLLVAAAALLVRFLRAEHADTDPLRRARIRRGGLVLAGAGTLAATWSLATHSAGGGLAPLSVPVDLVHLTAAGVWIGGLPVLLGVLLRSGDVAALRTAVPRFSMIAGVCVAVVVATGMYQSWRQVGTFSALVGTAYGLRLVGKLALVAALLTLGALARQWVRRHYGFKLVGVSEKRRARRGPPHGEIGRFRRLVAAEAVLAALLLGVTASLAGTEPARAEQDRERNPPRAAPVDGPLTLAVPFDAGGGVTGKGQVALALAPAAVGRNELHLAVLSPGGAPKQVAELRAELRLPSASIGPIPVPLTTAAQARYVTGGPTHYASLNVALPTAGQWELALIVRTSEFDQTTVRVPVNIG